MARLRNRPRRNPLRKAAEPIDLLAFPPHSLLMKRFLLSLVSLLALAGGLTAAPLRVVIVAAKADADAAAVDDLAGVLRQRGAEVERAETVPDDARLAQTDVILLAGSESKPAAENQRAALQKFAERGG